MRIFQQKFNVTDRQCRQRNPLKIHLDSQAIEIHKKRPIQMIYLNNLSQPFAQCIWIDELFI